MKILLVTEFFPSGKDLRFSGGVEARAFFIAKFLAKNHKVSVITSRDQHQPKMEKMFGFIVYRIGPKRGYTASASHLISRILFVKNAIQFGKNLKSDIVDGSNYISHFIAKQIAVYKKIPIVAWYPDVWVSNWIKNVGLYGIFGEALERYNLFRGFNSYIAISKYTESKLKRFAKNNINVVYCGIDQEEFTSKISKFKEPTIICISRLTKYKNIETLILSFAYLLSKVKNTKLIIVGTGPEENKLIKLTRNLKISKSIRFLNNLPRKDLIVLLKSSHIFSLPSVVEGFGIATIEAAAANLPYVNSSIPIHKEITQNGFGGFLVNPKKPLDFSNKLYILLTNKQTYRQKSEQAKKLSSNYSWKEAALKTEEIYKSLVNLKVENFSRNR